MQNRDDAAHEVCVTVDRRGGTVHDATFDLGPREPRECGGPCRPSGTGGLRVGRARPLHGDLYRRRGVHGDSREQHTLVGGPERQTRCDGATLTR
ncbi:hypothetical protein [Haloglomus irregulare]|uniref:hypothetical protein n=1 Tax=Haloglomus irregulare TaxID=2234134 RepID=UPI0011864C7E|nr:hypothetical protein [Haloglomus irregulare]